ncbi:hypothetical protein BBJ28_00023240 [Nothophytophthora sp. Chile5]|nr:hypothetical protein BBJ28_00023240 [Nothophytophthora sp. Chile5]
MTEQLVAGRRRLPASVAAVAILQAVWALATEAADPMAAPEDEATEKEGEEEIAMEEEEIKGGGGEAPAATTVPPTPTTTASAAEGIDLKTEDPDAEALVVVTSIPTEAALSSTASKANGGDLQPVVPQGADHDPAKNANVESVADNDATKAQEKEETHAPTQQSETPAPVKTETPIKPTVAPELTSKPALRTPSPTAVPDVATNDAAVANGTTDPPGYLNQGGNPLLLVALAGICCFFLLLWGRKRRLRASTSSGGLGAGSGSSKGPKVQYKQVPDEQHESPFGRSQDDDDDEYCDDYEEDAFANDRDNWDDWEGGSTQTQTPQLNPFVAAPSAPRPTNPRQPSSSSSPFKLDPPLPPPQQQHSQLHEIAIVNDDVALPTSVASNSSSDSFEVVTDEAATPSVDRHGATAADEKSESVDDLFSQFGMVPTFKKGVVVPPPPVSAAPASTSRPAATRTPPSASPLPTAAAASALFAAEMDDELTAVDAADDWGEDDEWVKGI